MVRVECAKCSLELSEPGWLLFSPPDETGRVSKQHVCVSCLDRAEKVAEEHEALAEAASALIKKGDVFHEHSFDCASRPGSQHHEPGKCDDCRVVKFKRAVSACEKEPG